MQANVANPDTNALPGVVFDLAFAGVPSSMFHKGVKINQQHSPPLQTSPETACNTSTARALELSWAQAFTGTPCIAIHKGPSITPCLPSFHPKANPICRFADNYGSIKCRCPPRSCLFPRLCGRSLCCRSLPGRPSPTPRLLIAAPAAARCPDRPPLCHPSPPTKYETCVNLDVHIGCAQSGLTFTSTCLG
jgi:hypothetical protein